MKEQSETILNAAKWSIITEFAAKIITPITNMILARIISPEAFGVVSTVTMVMSFADMFTDAGFQKYIVQHEFKSEKEKNKNANVAFWTNLGISILLWIVIIAFKDDIAIIVGNPGLGNVIAISCVQLLLTSFSSIQMALYRRDFDFKTLFLVRIFAVFLPFIITIPLAMMGFSYWSLIISSIITQLSNAIILTLKSKWKPQLFYSFDILKQMLSFSIWSFMESFSIWLTAWIDVFIISNSLNQYDLGLYKTSTSMINSLMAIITASILPVFFSTISRLQNKPVEFNRVFYKTQKFVAVLLFPLGVGVYIYRELITSILLGSQWIKADIIIGIWALVSTICIIFGNLSSEVYRAKGKPKLSLLSQILYIIVFIPSCVISIKVGFWCFIYTRSLIRLEAILVDLIIMKYVIKISLCKIFRNIIPALVASLIMGIFGQYMKAMSKGFSFDIISIIVCVFIYMGVLFLFPSIRKEIKYYLDLIKKNNQYKVEISNCRMGTEKLRRTK